MVAGSDCSESAALSPEISRDLIYVEDMVDAYLMTGALKKRAGEIASSSGNRIGVIRSAKMGVFQITPVNSYDVSDYGENDTSSLEKKVNAVVKAEFAIVKAWKGDTHGNLVYRFTANNFNQAMATAGKITIAEVEELVPAGTLDPNHIHTPGVFVQRIFQGTNYEKRIEFATTR